MRLIIAVAILSVAFALQVQDEPQEIINARAFLECTRKTLEGGLPSASIPDHDPFVFNHNISIPLEFIFASGSLQLNNLVMEGIPEFNLTEVDSVPENNPNGVFYDYSLYWRWFIITGQYVLDLGDLLNLSGDLSITLNEVVFAGYWNMSLPSENSKLNLDALFNKVTVETTDLNVTNTGLDDIVDQAGPLLTLAINAIPPEVVSEGLKTRINEKWISNITRVYAMVEYCNAEM